MCGIAGFWDKAGDQPGLEFIKNALSMLERRGPDGSHFDELLVGEGALTLGQRRLAIIDLSKSGRQPMRFVGHDGREFVVTYNGEIYNYLELRSELAGQGYIFTTQTDTEVLLAAWHHWGASALPRFRGMFAFCMFDAVQQTMTLVRDAFGIKPLYFKDTEEAFKFASEIPPLLFGCQDGPRANPAAVEKFIKGGGYDNDSGTFYEGIFQVLPGELIEIDLRQGSMRSDRWFTPTIRTDRRFRSLPDAIDAVRETFLDNVRLHLRSDVRIGAALSGGIDSSAIVCAMRHLEPDLDINTFTFVESAFEQNEADWARQVVQHVGANAHEVEVQPGEMLADLPDLVATLGEPFMSTSIYAQYRVFRLARDHGVTVTLDGQGADELIAGYKGWPGARTRSMLETGRWGELVRFLEGWGDRPGHSKRQAVQALMGTFLPEAFESVFKQLSGKFVIPEWYKPQAGHALSGSSVWSDEATAEVTQMRRHNQGSVYGRRLAAELARHLSGYGLSALLRHGDRTSMRWSIESRVPFLTQNFADLALSLPEEQLVSSTGETKHIFRQAMRGIVPDAILDRKEKIGFTTPEASWLHEAGKEPLVWLEGAEGLECIDMDVARAQVGEAINGSRSYDSSLWRLFSLSLWAGQRGVSLAA